MLRTSTRQMLAMTAVIASLGLITGCESSAVTGGGGDENNQPSNHDSENPAVVGNNATVDYSSLDNTAAIPVPENPGLGEDSAPIPVGYLQGSWRVATSDASDAPVVYLDFVQDEGDASATCTYSMSIGMGPLFEGQNGECDSVSYINDTLIAKFNPTNDQDELWTLTSTSRDGDKFTGVVTKKIDSSFSKGVVIERSVREQNDDGVRPLFEL